MSIIKSNKSFGDLTGNRILTSSQLQLYNIIEDTKTKEKFWNIFKCKVIDSDVVNYSLVYDLYTIREEDWWENIAYKYYNNVNVWWVLAMINNVVNPFEFLEAGKQIYILKRQYLNVFLDEIFKEGLM